MPIVIKGPDGAVNNFPDGTPDDIITKAMRQQYGGPEGDTNAPEAAPPSQDDTTADQPTPPPASPKQAELRAYDPTWRDRLATTLSDTVDTLGGNSRSPEWQRMISGLLGSTGLGKTDVGVIDFTPARIPLNAQEAKRNLEAGNYKDAALDTLGALPAPALDKVVGTTVKGVSRVASALHNAIPGATGPIAEAADKVGVKIPTVATYSDSTTGQGVQNLAGKMTTIPFIGAPLSKSTRTALDDMESAADSVTSRYLQKGNAPPPSVSNAAPAPVGDTVKQSMTDWISGGGKQDSPALMERIYHAVDQRVPNNVTAPLPNTTAIVQRLLARDEASHSDVASPAIKAVTDAINEPNGLTFQGMKDLRTNVGAMIDDGLLPNAGTVKPALKQIYGALTEDLNQTVAALGGREAVKAWDFANAVAEKISARREQLTKIIGSDGMMNSEGVVDRLVRYAGSQSTADLQKLRLARKTLGNDWDDVSASAIQRLGRNQANEFDLGQFTKRYEALSPDGRNTLFASTSKRGLKEELDSLSVLGTKFKQLQSYLNHSGTGGTAAVLGAIGTIASGGLHGLGLVVGSAVGGNAVARWLARPANLKATVRFGNEIYDALSKSSAGNLTKVALVNFARHVARDTGQDEREVLARLQGDTSRSPSGSARIAESLLQKTPQTDPSATSQPHSELAEVIRKNSPTPAPAPAGRLVRAMANP